jgi:carbon monoxide dehydrogenase subunit G
VGYFVAETVLLDMVTVSAATRVDADRATVFAYLDNPQSHVEVTPSLVGVDNVQSLPGGGKELEFTYSIAGVPLRGTLTQTVHDPEERLTFEMSGQLDGEIDIQIAPDNTGTRVTYTGNYEVPGKLLARVAEPFVRRYNERELETLLANLTTQLEGERA